MTNMNIDLTAPENLLMVAEVVANKLGNVGDTPFTDVSVDDIPTCYLLAGDNHSPIAIEYLRSALAAANVAVLEIENGVDTVHHNAVAMGNRPMVVINHYANAVAKSRSMNFGLPTVELTLTTATVNNLRVIHGLEAKPNVTLGGSGTFPDKATV